MRKSGLKMLSAMTYQATNGAIPEKKRIQRHDATPGPVTHRNGGGCAILVFAFPAGLGVKADSNAKNSCHKVRKNYD